MSRIVTQLSVALAKSNERPLLGFSLLYDEDHVVIADDSWTTLVRRAEVRTGIMVHQRAWTIGYAEDASHFAKVYSHAWKASQNDPVLIVIAPRGDRGDFFEAHYSESPPGREACLLSFYPTVLARYWDGDFISVVTRRTDDGELLDRLRLVTKDSKIDIRRSPGECQP